MTFEEFYATGVKSSDGMIFDQDIVVSLIAVDPTTWHVTWLHEELITKDIVEAAKWIYERLEGEGLV